MAEAATSVATDIQKRWGGSREISKSQLRDLATAMVEEVKERGPFLSVAEFVNRRLGNDPNDANNQMGALQEAIDQTTINDSFDLTSQTTTAADFGSMIAADGNDVGIRNLNAAIGKTGRGAPGYITQADVLMSLAPFVKVRSDTFRIRTYGDSRDEDGNIVSQAWCEAIVQRSTDFIDPTNAPEATSLSSTNQQFGRKFNIVHFKWLNQQEI